MSAKAEKKNKQHTLQAVGGFIDKKERAGVGASFEQQGDAYGG